MTPNATITLGPEYDRKIVPAEVLHWTDQNQNFAACQLLDGTVVIIHRTKIKPYEDPDTPTQTPS